MFVHPRYVHLGVLLLAAAVALTFPSMAPSPYEITVGIAILNYAVLSTSWNFVGGFTGYVSLGHGAFAGLGAYGTGLLVAKGELPPFAALFVAALMVAALAVPVGYAALRVRGASFVIVSIALVLILLLVFQSWASLTGGSRGLVVPRPFPGMLRAEHHRTFYFLFLALLALALLVWWVIDRSRFGMGLKAIREDEDKAQSLGIPTFTYKLVVFVVSAAFTALAGGLYALWFGDLDPVFQFSILSGSYMVLMALLGGVRQLYGPLLGALIVGYALEYSKVEFGDTPLHLVVAGLLLGVVVMFMPDGVIPAAGALLRRFRRTGDASIREVTAAELRERGEEFDGRDSTEVRNSERSGAEEAPEVKPEAEPEPSLATTGLTKAFGGVTALDSATVTFHHGKVNALIGPNGSGKTTFFNCVTGMIRPDSGHVTYRGRDLTGRPPHRIARAGIGRSFQLCRVFPRMTVLDNLLAAVRPRGLTGQLARSGTRAETERARYWLTRMGIEHLEQAEARQLSWGQQKLLELAGVLTSEPELILLDEPAGGVNPALIDRIGDLVRELNAEGRTFLIVEHNMDMVMSLSDHVVVFDRGRPIAQGPPSLIQSDERVLGAYLGV